MSKKFDHDSITTVFSVSEDTGKGVTVKPTGKEYAATVGDFSIHVGPITLYLSRESLIHLQEVGEVALSPSEDDEREVIPWYPLVPAT